MKTTKILQSALSVAALAFTFSACSQTAAVSDNTTAANNANKANTAKVANSKSPATENKTAPASSPKSDIRSVDFLNYNYQSPSCAEDLGIASTVKVSKGKFKDGDNYYSVKDNNFMYADANGDGREDAVVTIDCGNSAGTFRSFEIHAFSFENGKATRLAALDFNQVTNDYTEYYPEGFVFAIPQNGVTVDNDGTLVIDVMTDGSFAMPKNISTFIYKLNGDKFVLTAKPKKRSFKG